MSPATERIFLAALALHERERRELVEALQAADWPADEPPIDPAFGPEIRRRSAEIEAGSVEPSPWSVVPERVWRRVVGRPRV